MMNFLFLLAALAHLPATPPTGGVEEGRAAVIPWSGYWWPLRSGGTARPLGLYDQLTGKRAAEWEKTNHPPKPDVPAWHGYCHGWAASAVLEREPNRTQMIRNGRRSIPMTIADQKALLAMCHARDVANVYGTRFRDAARDDKQDLRPDVLWRLLKLYVKQQGLPLILDVEAGPEVWNYPVYAYRVEYQPDGEGGECRATMTLWLADNDVAPNFVGLKVRRHTYSFRFRLISGAVVSGSGRWDGISKDDHPDFAWFPFVAVPENPELDYTAVRKMFVDPAGPDAAPVNFTPDNLPVRAELPERERPIAISPMELAALVANRTSAFHLDVTVNRFDGGRYAVGEAFTVRGTSQRDGYLTLLHIDPSGALRLQFPPDGSTHRVTADKPFEVGTAAPKFTVVGQPGTHRIKAIVTTRPLLLTGLKADGEDGGGGRVFRLPPTQQRAAAELISRLTRRPPGDAEADGVDLKLLGPFAQDEVAFDVRSPNKPK